MIDQVILMSEGMCIYQGSPQALSSYFERFGFLCNEKLSVTDFAIDMISIDTRNTETIKRTSTRVNQLACFWQFHSKAPSYSTQYNTRYQDEEGGYLPIIIPRQQGKRYMACFNWMRQLYELSGRAFRDRYRDWPQLTIRFGTVLVFAAISAILFANMTHEYAGIQDRVGLLFFVLINQVITHSINAAKVSNVVICSTLCNSECISTRAANGAKRNFIWSVLFNSISHSKTPQ